MLKGNQLKEEEKQENGLPSNTKRSLQCGRQMFCDWFCGRNKFYSKYLICSLQILYALLILFSKRCLFIRQSSRNQLNYGFVSKTNFYLFPFFPHSALLFLLLNQSEYLHKKQTMYVYLFQTIFLCWFACSFTNWVAVFVTVHKKNSFEFFCSLFHAIL